MNHSTCVNLWVSFATICISFKCTEKYNKVWHIYLFNVKKNPPISFVLFPSGRRKTKTMTFINTVWFIYAIPQWTSDTHTERHRVIRDHFNSMLTRLGSIVIIYIFAFRFICFCSGFTQDQFLWSPKIT